MIEYLPVIKELGFPIALCIVLLLTIRHQNAQLVKSQAELVRSLTDRIKTLEGIATELTSKITKLEEDRINRADEYGHSLKDVAGRCANAIRDFNSWMDKMWTWIAQSQEYRPTPAAPPPPPKQPETRTIGGKA